MPVTEAAARLRRVIVRDTYLTEFCRLLADRIEALPKGDITPPEFLLVWSLLGTDVTNARGSIPNGPKGPVRSILAGMPIMPLINASMRGVLTGAFPQEFTDETLRERASVNEEAARLLARV